MEPGRASAARTDRSLRRLKKRLVKMLNRRQRLKVVRRRSQLARTISSEDEVRDVAMRGNGLRQTVLNLVRAV